MGNHDHTDTQLLLLGIWPRSEAAGSKSGSIDSTACAMVLEASNKTYSVSWIFVFVLFTVWGFL